MRSKKQEGSGYEIGPVRESRTSGFSAHAWVELNKMAGALYGLNQIGKDHLVLKEKQYESLKNNIVKGTDTLAILPTG